MIQSKLMILEEKSLDEVRLLYKWRHVWVAQINIFDRTEVVYFQDIFE